MAIKVGGTTVIDDSRNLSNIAGGLKTVNGNSMIGSGNISAGASTTYNAVGTYIFGYYYKPSSAVTASTTVSGSSIYPASIQSQQSSMPVTGTGVNYCSRGSSTVSGTWRMMGANQTTWSNTRHTFTCFVRIS